RLMNVSFWALALAAASVGALHSVAPDHWVPFAALARARRWSAGRTARITLACGFGHVTVSAALGVLALVLGLGALRVLGERLEAELALARPLRRRRRRRHHRRGRPGGDAARDLTSARQ